MSFMGLRQIPQQKVWSFRAWRKSFPKWFVISAHGKSHFPNGLAFPRMARVVSRMVWSFRAWRKLFPERFVISAHSESHFPNSFDACGPPANHSVKGLKFPRMTKVVSRMVWCFRVCRIDLFYFQIDNLLVCLYCLTCNSLFSINFSSTFA